MTRMLASVANSAEAQVVLQLGADLIDLKDPARGALGAIPMETAREIDGIHRAASPDKRDARRSTLRWGTTPLAGENAGGDGRGLP